MLVKKDVVEMFQQQTEAVLTRLKEVEGFAKADLVIDDFNLDGILIRVPKLQSKYLTMYNDEVIKLKDLYSLKEKVKLERWKYWSGKQTDKYYQENGVCHEKILKSDIDKYMAADDKLSLVNDYVTAQKTLVDFIEKTLKEISNIGFHIKSIIEWRKFTSGV